MTLWSGRVESQLAPEVWDFLHVHDAELLPYDIQGTLLHGHGSPRDETAETIGLTLRQVTTRTASGLVRLESTPDAPEPSAAHPSRLDRRRIGPAPHARVQALSYSSLTELERCGYRYYLERVLGLAEDRSVAGGSAPVGLYFARARPLPAASQART